MKSINLWLGLALVVLGVLLYREASLIARHTRPEPRLNLPEAMKLAQVINSH